MNDMLQPLPVRPALPQPGRERWQPLRLGLVELFLYDSEEFWFRDGHLLLRGNNGTGKSKVLSLTLPFLFDAQLRPSRIEPDGDSGKKMAWNLLVGGYQRRTGYTWIEFGRRAADGSTRYLTLGAGLSAVAGRTQVESWFFMLDDARIGQDLWLTGDQRVVLTRERLREAIAGRGQVFENNATAYRRAIDERLFNLGAQRYTALMDTLIQLRQPQLSKKPDEAGLSHALTEACRRWRRSCWPMSPKRSTSSKRIAASSTNCASWRGPWSASTSATASTRACWPGARRASCARRRPTSTMPAGSATSCTSNNRMHTLRSRPPTRHTNRPSAN
jgi:hypothetical protein